MKHSPAVSIEMPPSMEGITMPNQTQEEKEAAKAAAAAEKEQAEKDAADQAAIDADAASAAAKATKPGRTWTSERDPETGVVTARLR
jgi:hypothetical protein